MSASLWTWTNLWQNPGKKPCDAGLSPLFLTERGGACYTNSWFPLPAAVAKQADARDLKSLGLLTVPVRSRSAAPECVDERCSTENTAQKCGVFAYLTPFHAGKSPKKRFFRKISFSTREATFQRCIGTLLWTGVTRTPRLKNKENQQPLYHPPLFCV